MKTPRVAAMDYLARREHTRVELQRKLKQKGYDREAIDDALDKLRDEDLQCDQRFAINYIEQRARNGYGPLKIKSELKQHGVDDSTIDAVMSSLAIDWQSIAHNVWQKKFGIPAQDLKEHARQHRFMLQRGFEHFKKDFYETH